MEGLKVAEVEAGCGLVGGMGVKEVSKFRDAGVHDMVCKYTIVGTLRWLSGCAEQHAGATCLLLMVDTTSKILCDAKGEFCIR